VRIAMAVVKCVLGKLASNDPLGNQLALSTPGDDTQDTVPNEATLSTGIASGGMY